MLNDTRPLRQQIVEGVQGLVALAIAIVGLFFGGSAFGWIGALVLGVVGFLGAVFVFLAVVLVPTIRDPSPEFWARKGEVAAARATSPPCWAMMPWRNSASGYSGASSSARCSSSAACAFSPLSHRTRA